MPEASAAGASASKTPASAAEAAASETAASAASAASAHNFLPPVRRVRRAIADNVIMLIIREKFLTINLKIRRLKVRLWSKSEKFLGSEYMTRRNLNLATVP
jgi:hypothetical protein